MNCQDRFRQLNCLFIKTPLIRCSPPHWTLAAEKSLCVKRAGGAHLLQELLLSSDHYVWDLPELCWRCAWSCALSVWIDTDSWTISRLDFGSTPSLWNWLAPNCHQSFFALHLDVVELSPWPYRHCPSVTTCSRHSYRSYIADC